MFDVSIPEGLYEQAVRAAEANKISLEAFVAEAVRLRVQQESLELTPRQVATIRQAQAEIASGQGLTLEQVETQLAAKKAAWLTANPT